MASLVIVLNLILFHMGNSDVVCFSLNPHKEYCVKLIEYKDAGNGIEMTVELDPETWEYADLLMFFNLYWDKRHPGKISGMKEVQISMYLDRELYKELKARGELLADKEAYQSATPDHPMRKTTAWFATEVTEEVDLPEELKSMGTLREGFTTHWKD